MKQVERRNGRTVTPSTKRTRSAFCPCKIRDSLRTSASPKRCERCNRVDQRPPGAVGIDAHRLPMGRARCKYTAERKAKTSSALLMRFMKSPGISTQMAPHCRNGRHFHRACRRAVLSVHWGTPDRLTGCTAGRRSVRHRAAAVDPPERGRYRRRHRIETTINIACGVTGGVGLALYGVEASGLPGGRSNAGGFPRAFLVAPAAVQAMGR